MNPPVPTGTAPAFTNSASFTSAIEAAENQSAAGATNFFAAPGTGTVTLTLGGTDASRFTLTAGGTLTFNDAPNFEMPRGSALSAGNTNDYALTVTAMNDFGSAPSGAITVRVTDANDAPVLSAIPTPTFMEYTAGGFTITATDEDLPAQTLTFALTGETHGAALDAGGGFSWTPREMDGTVVRMFTAEVTDSGTPAQTASVTFAITAAELPNRAPTGASITSAATPVTNPATPTVTAAATDPDTGDVLTYTWSSDATGDSFSPATGASVTWTPPTVTTATVVVLTVTVTDSTDGSVTATQNVTVNPMPVAPVFTNSASFTTPISVAENTTAVGAAGFFAASGAVAYVLTGVDMSRFTLTNAGTLTFNDAPDFEMPAGGASADSNTYTIGITVRSSANLTTQSGTITIQVTDVSEAPVAPASVTTGVFTEHSESTFNYVATDEDTGQMLSYILLAPAHGATMTTAGMFTWTPGEDDGGMARAFNVAITDTGATPLTTNGMFTITPVELDNRAPTGTVSVSSPVTAGSMVSVSVNAADLDGDTLTYAWTSSATGDTFGSANMASTTWVPASVSTATTVTLTVNVGDGTVMTPVTADVVVNPAAVTPTFTNAAMLATAIEAAENQSAVGAADLFAATGTGTVALTLTGADAARFSITDAGALTFNDAPDFENPRGMPSTPAAIPTTTRSP